MGMYTVYFARTILMPIVAAAILALLFRPVVRRCRRYKIPDSVGAALVLFTVVLIVFSLFANLIGPGARMARHRTGPHADCRPEASCRSRSG